MDSMEEEYLTTGPVRTVTVEQAELIKSPFSWREGERIFAGRLVCTDKGLPAELTTPRTKTVWVHDGSGDLLKEDVFDSEGHLLASREYQRDTARGLVFIKEKDTVTVNKGNPAGAIRTEQRYRGDLLELTIETALGPEGKPTTREYREGGGRFLRRESFEYDNLGRLRSFRCLNDAGVLITHDLYEYPLEHRGNWLKRIRYSVREEGRRVREVPVEILYRDIITDRLDAEELPASAGEGTLTFPDGTYRGEIRQNLMHGAGILSFNDGSRYEGTFVNGIMEGHGVFVQADGRRYEGDFKNGRMEGSGYCRWPNGDEYRGQFQGGMMHGIGTFTWNNGARFKGLFEKNRRTDQGLIEAENPDHE
jgi:hypothetical protein